MPSPQDLFVQLDQNRWNVSSTSALERSKKLLQLKTEITRRREDIKHALYCDFKKPYPESELTEIHTVIDEINFAVKNLKKWMRPKNVPSPIVLFGSKSYVHYEAKGVVLILSPWNYPFSLLINPLVAAIAAGNCVMAKPSEKTPATSRLLREIVESVFLPNEVALIEGDSQVAQQLLELPFDHIFFTGSPQIGKIVMAAASKNLASITLELGGKSPVIIDRSADLKAAVKKIAWGKFINGGQTCVAPDYLFVHEKDKDEFYQLMKKQIEIYYGKTKIERHFSGDFARIIDEQAFKRLQEMLLDQRSLLDDQCVPEELFFPPTILRDVPYGSPIMDSEIFGPILPVLVYSQLEEVIDYIRRRPKPLALYLFSENRSVERLIKNSISAGGMAINHVVIQLANPYLPFGGVGTSGMGSYHGAYGFKAFSHEKAVLLQGKFSLSALYFPPYGTWLKRIAFRFLRFLE